MQHSFFATGVKRDAGNQRVAFSIDIILVCICWYAKPKSFRAARNILAGVELMHLIRKGQRMMKGCSELPFANQFYALAGKIRSV
jgi:hypothetical protein